MSPSSRFYIIVYFFVALASSIGFAGPSMGELKRPSYILFLQEGTFHPETGKSAQQIFSSEDNQREIFSSADVIDTVLFDQMSNKSVRLTIVERENRSLFPVNEAEPYNVYIDFDTPQKATDFKNRITEGGLLFTIFHRMRATPAKKRFPYFTPTKTISKIYLPDPAGSEAVLHRRWLYNKKVAVFRFDGSAHKDFSILEYRLPHAVLEDLMLWPKPVIYSPVIDSLVPSKEVADSPCADILKTDFYVSPND